MRTTAAPTPGWSERQPPQEEIERGGPICPLGRLDEHVHRHRQADHGAETAERAAGGGRHHRHVAEGKQARGARHELRGPEERDRDGAARDLDRASHAPPRAALGDASEQLEGDGGDRHAGEELGPGVTAERDDGDRREEAERHDELRVPAPAAHRARPHGTQHARRSRDGVRGSHGPHTIGHPRAARPWTVRTAVAGLVGCMAHGPHRDPRAHQAYPGGVTALDSLTLTVEPGSSVWSAPMGPARARCSRSCSACSSRRAARADRARVRRRQGGLEVRALVGYMPEHDCLPPDCRPPSS